MWLYLKKIACNLCMPTVAYVLYIGFIGMVLIPELI